MMKIYCKRITETLEKCLNQNVIVDPTEQGLDWTIINRDGEIDKEDMCENCGFPTVWIINQEDNINNLNQTE